MSFTEWLRRKKDERTPVGSFADDWTTDPDRPRATSLDVIVAYLAGRNACQGAIRAARLAWSEYRVTLKGDLSSLTQPAGALRFIGESSPETGLARVAQR